MREGKGRLVLGGGARTCNSSFVALVLLAFDVVPHLWPCAFPSSSGLAMEKNEASDSKDEKNQIMGSCIRERRRDDSSRGRER